MAEWRAVSFHDLEGWDGDDHLAAFSCFRVSAKALVAKHLESRPGTPPTRKLLAVAQAAMQLDPATMTSADARSFFETRFQPMKAAKEQGFVTAYFEPEVPASRVKTADFPYPIFKRPDDLVKITDENRPQDWPEHLEYARQTTKGFVEFPDRGAIDNGALTGLGLELFWLKSAIEAFYIHIQGSARLAFEDGGSTRISFAGKTGHPYTSIGRLLVKREVFTVEEANMQNIRAWLEEDSERALELLHHNRSYIFFAEAENSWPDLGPVAGAGVPLTPGRSLAVDRKHHVYGTPVWIATEKPLPEDTKPFRRLMIAQDTGSAIVGPKRGDIFIGSGREAGMIAGSVRHDTEFVILSPEP